MTNRNLLNRWRPERVNGFHIALGGILGLIGVILIIGGTWLTVLGGSWYYLLAGLALLISGVLIALSRALGAWVYLATVVLTFLWALYEVGLDGWALVPRLVAPLVLLMPVLLVLPGLADLTRERGRQVRLYGLGGLVVFAVVLLGLVSLVNRPSVNGVVPEPQRIYAYDRLAQQTRAGEWPTYGGGLSAQRYADGAQITPANVKSLERVWTYRTGDIPDKFGAETTPLKIGDTLYGCTAMNKLFALDARNGKARWRYDPQVKKEYIPYTAACRGVAYYEVPGAMPDAACARRIIEGTLDGRLIAVDAATGRPCSDFGQGGAVSITEGMGKVIPGMVAITSAPAIVQGVVVTGHQVQDGQYRWAPSGVIQGFDAVTGELRFAWDMMRPDRNGRPPAGETYTPGTPNMWTTATGDEALGLVYLPMGNSGADYYSSTRRPLEKDYASSLVALDVQTGKPRWKFQTVRHDVWDYDLGSQVSLIDFPVEGQLVPALVLPSKTGDFYVLDRRTGQPLTPVEERTAPTGGVEPQERAQTQLASGYNSVRKPNLKETDMWGMSPIDQMICRIQYRQARYEGPFTPPSVDRSWIEYPGYNGGSDWGSVAVDPRRGVIIANYNDMPNYNRLLTRAQADKEGLYPIGDPKAVNAAGAEGAGAQAGVPYAINVNAGWRLRYTRMLCKEPPYGGIRAIELTTGKTLWDRPFGSAQRNGPFGIPSMLPLEIGTPNNGGPAVTAGGLIFIAATTDNLLRAIDIRTGKTVWSDVLPAGGQATPMVYEQDGRQYVVIMAGGHHFMETPAGDYLIAYALPEKR